MDISENYEDTPIKWYRPEDVDEYIVIVNLPEDWDEVHNYIINENEIDGIPNRKIECIFPEPNFTQIFKTLEKFLDFRKYPRL